MRHFTGLCDEHHCHCFAVAFRDGPSDPAYSTKSDTTSAAPTPQTSSTPAPTCSSTSAPAAQTSDLSGDCYHVFYDNFQIDVKKFDPRKFRSATVWIPATYPKVAATWPKWCFKTLTNDPSRYQSSASGNLPFGTTTCEGRAVMSNGRSSAPGCIGIV